MMNAKVIQQQQIHYTAKKKYMLKNHHYYNIHHSAQHSIGACTMVISMSIKIANIIIIILVICV